MLDANFAFDVTPQTIGAANPAIDVLSTNVYDAGAAKKLFAGDSRRPGFMAVGCLVTAGTNPTLRARLVGADNDALTTNPEIIADTGAVAFDDAGSALAANGFFHKEVPITGQKAAKRYYGIIYTPGTVDTAVKVTGVIAFEPQTGHPGKRQAVPA